MDNINWTGAVVVFAIMVLCPWLFAVVLVLAAVVYALIKAKQLVVGTVDWLEDYFISRAARLHRKRFTL